MEVSACLASDCIYGTAINDFLCGYCLASGYFENSRDKRGFLRLDTFLDATRFTSCYFYYAYCGCTHEKSSFSNDRDVAFLFTGIVGLLSGNHLVLLWAILIGIGAGCSFSLAMTLFGLRTSNARDAAELSGMSQSVGYLLAALGPTLFGYLHDLSNGWNVPLIVLLVITCFLLISGIASGRNRLIGE